MNPILLQITDTAAEERPEFHWQDWIPRDPGVLILIGALLLLAVGLFVWAALVRKRRHRPHYTYPHHDSAEAETKREEHHESGGFFLGKRHRRRRHRYRRNPTLAEAGGLPPIRSDERPPGQV